MIEIKVSQGAKPGHGGILPGGQGDRGDRRGPARARRARTSSRRPTTRRSRRPLEMMRVHRPAARAQRRQAGRLQALHRRPARVHGDRQGDDRRPASTPTSSSSTAARAAPVRRRWSSPTRSGAPLNEGLLVVQNTLVGAGIRDRFKIGASGKMVTASAMARSMALGADWCNSARAFMFAVGCIQSQRCHTNQCPVGVTTQDPKLQRALDRAGQGRAGAQLPPQHRARPRRDDRGDGPGPHQRAAPVPRRPPGQRSSRRWPSTRSTTSLEPGALLDGHRPTRGSRGSGTRRRPSRSAPGRPPSAPRPPERGGRGRSRGPPGRRRRRRLRRPVRGQVPRRAPVEVTLVDRSNHHLFQPLLYQVATGILSEGEIAPPIRDILRRARERARRARRGDRLRPRRRRTVVAHAGPDDDRRGTATTA